MIEVYVLIKTLDGFEIEKIKGYRNIKVIDNETKVLIKSRKFYKNCGSKLKNRQKVCKICGNKVE